MAFWSCMGVVTAWSDASVDEPSSHESRITNHPFHMGAPSGGDRDGETQGATDLMVAEPETKTKRPPKYKVILLNDDYTPMDFVVMVLEQIFRRSHEEALQIMLEVHQKGSGLAGVYTRDIAETKVDLVVEYARINEYPLSCALESES